MHVNDDEVRERGTVYRKWLSGAILTVGLVLASGISTPAHAATEKAAQAQGNGSASAIGGLPELTRVFGPYRLRNSGADHYNLTFTGVASTFTDHCVQNSGRGAYTTKAPITFYGTTHLREYTCSYLLTTAQVLAANGLAAVDQYTHDSYDNSANIDPQFSNPDRDSLRYRNKINAKYTGSPSYFLRGANMSSHYWEGSPAGADGYYHTTTIVCDPRVDTGAKVASLGDIDRYCDDSEMADIADDRTTGTSEILVVGLESSYDED